MSKRRWALGLIVMVALLLMTGCGNSDEIEVLSKRTDHLEKRTDYLEKVNKELLKEVLWLHDCAASYHRHTEGVSRSFAWHDIFLTSKENCSDITYVRTTDGAVVSPLEAEPFSPFSRYKLDSKNQPVLKGSNEYIEMTNYISRYMERYIRIGNK